APLRVGEPVHQPGAGHVHAHNALAVLQMFAERRGGIYARRPLQNVARRDIRQRNIEGTCQVHFGLGTCTATVMPGLNSPRAPVSSASTSIVPLDGSTTGLISMILTSCFSAGRSGAVSAICCPFFSRPMNFSGSVKRTRNGPSAVTQNNRSPLATDCPSRT